MKIAFFTDTLLRQTHGIAVAIVELANELAKRGHSIYLFAPKPVNDAGLLHKNIILKECPSVSAFFNRDFRIALPFSLHVLNFIRSEGINILHLHTPLMLGVQAIIASKLLRLPLVGTYHSFFAHPEYLAQVKLKGRFVENLAWAVSNFYYNRCDRIICPAKGARDELIAHGCKRKITVIPHGIDMSVFDNSRAALVRKKFRKSGKFLLYVGRVSYGKNLPYLLECCALAFRKVQSLKLVLVGDGPLMAEIKEKVKELGIEGKVIFTGLIKHEELVKSGIFGACDIFVTASRTETGPLVVIEAQANGLVCVMVKGKGMSLVNNGINGYVVDPDDRQAFADAIISLVKNRKDYARMRKETLCEVKKFEISNVAKAWEKAYSELVKIPE